MIRIGIDPGVRMCGVAIECPAWAREPVVRKAFLARSTEATLQGRAIQMATQIRWQLPSNHLERTLVVEGQQFYGTAKSKGDPNQLIDLAVVTGVMVGMLGCDYTPLVPLPREWKGTIPKDVHHDRLRRDHPEWIAAVEAETPKSMQHHVWDAVGLLEWMRGKGKP